MLTSIEREYIFIYIAYVYSARMCEACRAVGIGDEDDDDNN